MSDIIIGTGARVAAWTLAAVLITLILIVIGVCLYVDSTPNPYLKVHAARVQAFEISSACTDYLKDHDGLWPPILEALLEPGKNGKAYLAEGESLIDPWGNRYQYDAAGLRNNGKRPDIWTTSPAGELIGNWPTAGHGD